MLGIWAGCSTALSPKTCNKLKDNSGAGRDRYCLTYSVPQAMGSLVRQPAKITTACAPAFEASFALFALHSVFDALYQESTNQKGYFASSCEARI